MEMIDIGVLGQELAGDEPCGPNLEYDPAFQELELNLLGKPEVQYGKTITPAVPPDWKLVRRQAADLLGRTRDLRILVPLARALLALDGLPGLASGLQAIDSMLDAHWERVHPQLDPDDDNDPTLRINSLAQLTDSTTLLRELHDTAFVRLPGLGPLSLRQLDYASGEVPVPAGHTAMALPSVEQALQDVPQEELQQAFAAVVQALASVSNIEGTLVRRVGNTQALNLEPLMRPLARVRDALQRHVRVDIGPVAVAAAADAPAPAVAAPAAAPVPASTGEIGGRDDVILALDKLLAYYERHEPSSPVPLLLERARRLVPKTFLEIMEDLAPDSVGQLQAIRGPRQQ